MTPVQIIQIQKEIYTHLSKRQLKDSFKLLNTLISFLQDWKSQETLNEMSTSYKYMIQYMLDGFDDPERKKIYEQLVISSYNLTDKVTDLLLEKESPDFYYSKRRYQNSHSVESLQRCFEKADNAINAVSLNSLLDENSLNWEERERLRKDSEQIASELFIRIWTNYPASEEDYNAIRNSLSPNHFPDAMACLVVSAITLGVLHRYDEQKLMLLIDAYTSTSEEVKQRSLCGILIVLYSYQERIALSPPIESRINALKENQTFNTDVHNIFLQLIKSRETEKISRKLTEEILPEMIKISPTLYKKIKQDESMSDINALEQNPEWQNLLDEAGITDKLKELTDLQMEGADVFLSTFSNLKSFPFFNEISNWFLPFSIDNSALNKIFTNDQSDHNFKKIISASHFLCNSDKYSFCLSLNQVPASQRNLMMSQFNVEGMEMENFEKEENLLKDGKNREIISNQYLQDFYRFFKLHPRRLEFSDPFASHINLFHVDLLKSVFSDNNSLRLIGEFYFKKEYYIDALEMFELLSKKDHSNSQLYQKIGYCYQMSGNYEEALEAYLKAEMIYPNSFWTLRRIASCYRNLKKSEMALDYYHRAEKLQPDNLSVEMNIGHCYLEQKNYGSALKHYFKVDYLDPKSNKAWRPIAWCSFLIGKSDQAQRYYEKILEKKSTSLDLMNAGHVEFSLGNIRKAIKYYRSSIAADMNNIDRFLQNFEQDIPDLANAGILQSDIPILLDQLRYSVSED